MTLVEFTVTPEAFRLAVEAMKTAPFGHTLEAIKLHISDAKAELKPHMNPEYAAARVAELAFWMEELNRWERANQAAKDWSGV